MNTLHITFQKQIFKIKVYISDKMYVPLGKTLFFLVHVMFGLGFPTMK